MEKCILKGWNEYTNMTETHTHIWKYQTQLQHNLGKKVGEIYWLT